METITSLNYEKITIETVTPIEVNLYKPYEHCCGPGPIYMEQGEPIGRLLITKLSPCEKKCPPLTKSILNFEGILSENKVIGSLKVSKKDRDTGLYEYTFQYWEINSN